MGYYMRFVVTDKKGLDLQLIEKGLKQSDTAYTIANRRSDRNMGDIIYGGETLGQIEINGPGDSLFSEELQELKEFAEEAHGRQLKKVLDCLNRAKLIVAVQVLFQEKNPEATLERLGPLWQWLFMNRDGLLQVDGEGYYNGKPELIFEVE
ncbi:MAG: hypothetical protein A3K60_04505 [Euryarchaeota archaeon RBG_19FT_COMBO_56_21]|nr:MAG: hypothetical protein A3K60_04505 [Euryarchaeota archaeon RBG_19FT_COMBO_56_21]